ncbi:uncharacterized protein LOC125177601 [Hyalella azteca]|uniref:Uncharacterized protein LOC125177601 n=1 Tax=Hyalella azteca TaxID=294128 RepID=A0A979FFU4_HYAAZ|nr:uncharacterized protein LOC125177601 [Hyalella azteca]
MKQWHSIASSYEELHSAFRTENPSCSDNEELQYQLFGYDFVFDLLCLRDLLSPICALMELVQDMQQPHWKITLLWPKVATFLKNRSSDFRVEDYPSLAACHHSIRPGGSYLNVPLLDGWLVESHKAGGPVKWCTREVEDIQDELVKLAAALHKSFVSRVSKGCGSEATDAASMDAAAVILLLTKPDVDIEIEIHTNSASSRRLVQQAESYEHLELQAPLSRKYLSSYVTTLHEAFKSGLGRDAWLSPPVTGPITSVSETESSASYCKFELLLRVSTPSGDTIDTRLNEKAIYQSLYKDPRLYKRMGYSACRLLDFALHRGGSEAVVETFYSTMRSQQHHGGQNNSTLQRRSKLRWMLPPVGSQACERLLDMAARIYYTGDSSRGVNPHRGPFFKDARAKNYDVSKVVNRRAHLQSRCPFIGCPTGEDNEESDE